MNLPTWTVGEGHLKIEANPVTKWVVDMDSRRPHIVEAMRCRKCSHEFTSVHLASISSANWQCPECGEMSCEPFTDDGLLDLDRDELRAIVREVRGARDALVEMYNAELERCGEYLKEDETPSQCIKRNRDDANAALGMLADERKKVEALTLSLTASGEALREYGHHKNSCRFVSNVPNPGIRPGSCTCGLEAAMEKAK